MSDIFSGGGVLGALGSVVNAATQEDINRQNIQFQKDTNAQNVALMREQWGREDNAVQRRAADLQKAGMNPLLAAGGAAQAGPAASLKSPQAGEAPQWGNVVTDALSARKQSADIAQTEANVALTQSQKAGQDAQNAWAYGTLDGRVQMINNQAEQSTALLATNIQLGLVSLDRAEAERDTAQIKNEFLLNDRVYEYGGYTFRQGPDNVMTGIWVPGLKYLETELQKRGVQQADLDIAAQKIQNEILQKSDNWFTTDKIVGDVSKVAGSIAEGISSAAFARKQFTSTRQEVLCRIASVVVVPGSFTGKRGSGCGSTRSLPAVGSASDVQCTSPLPVNGGVPCGQCLACRLTRATEWAVRCMHERAFWDRSSFATLTYDDEHLPADNSLDLAEFTKFWKRLRKQLGARKMRYYGCGEYGERFGRPHYHAIIFGVGARERALVDRAWGLGHVYLGSVTGASARYVADYVGKAISPKAGPSLRGADALAVLTGAAYGSRRVPFAVMSQGLGRAYLDAHGSSFLSRPMTVEGKRVPVPRYYRDRLRKEVKVLDDLWVSEDFAPIVKSVEERELYDRSWFNREQVEANLRAKSGLAPKGFM